MKSNKFNISIHVHHSLKTYLTIFLLIVLFCFQKESVAQNQQFEILNKGALFATSSILQDFDNDGDFDIVITRREKSGLNAGVEWLENDGTGQFPRHELFQDLGEPVDIDAADFDNDGDIDYIVSDRGLGADPGQLVLFLRQEDDTFIKQTIQAGIKVYQSGIADFDGNGTIDVVSVGFDLSTVNLHLNEGSLNFTKKELADDVNQVVLVEVDDIDDDGDQDIVFGGPANGNFVLLRNNGSADFDSQALIAETSTGGGVSSVIGGIAISDINNDGQKDILTFRGAGFGGLVFLDGSNNFNPSFIEIVDIDLGGDIVVVDIDGNGLKDIIRQHMSNDFLSILYQESSMSFRTEFLELNWDNRALFVGPQMQVGDLDGDDDLDLVFPEAGNVDGDLSWFENIDGKLYRHYLHSEIQEARISKFGDIDNDGDIDIVLTAGDDSPSGAFRENEIIWYENRGSDGFVEWRIDDDILFPADLELDDIDGDGNVDVVVTAGVDNELVWYKKDGLNWEKIIIDGNVNRPLGCVVADIDADGDSDIVLCVSGDNTISLYINDGSGNFTRQFVDQNVREPREVEVADLDSDGDVDLVVISTDTDNALVIETNDGNQSFQREILFQDQEVHDVEVGDWDGDGDTDILSAFGGRNQGRDVALFSNDGSAVFTDSTLLDRDNLAELSGLTSLVPEATSALKLTDIDNDDDLDLLFGRDTFAPIFGAGFNQDGIIESIDILFERSGGGVVGEVFGIDANDVNGDNIVDLVAADSDNGNLMLFVGSMDDGPDPTPTPAPTTTPETTPTPTTPTTPTPSKSFTFGCDRDFDTRRSGLERLVLQLGQDAECILKLNNLEPGAIVEVSANLRKGLRPSVTVEPTIGVADHNEEIEFTITGFKKGMDWISWAVANEDGEFEYDKEAYDNGLAWGMFVLVK